MSGASREGHREAGAGVAGRSVPDLERTDAYDYFLPPGRIARYPAERRDASRLLVVPREGREEAGARDRPEAGFRDLRFADLPSLLRSGDLLVLNESRVLPVRLLGTKPTGAECEILLLRPLGGGGGVSEDGRRWEALVRPGAKLKPGRRVRIASDLEVEIEASLPGGERIVRLHSEVPPADALARHGRIPLPPYLERDEEPVDRERYQTVYAASPASPLAGSVAAPTAGLHFTDELLDRVRAAGVGIAKVTLHVGPGTFRPVDSDTVRGHRMHRERWFVPEETARAIRVARGRGGRVWAVGTTVVRTLESAARDGAARDGATRHDPERGGVDPIGADEVCAGEGETDLFITPGRPVRTVDGLVTNFHLPRSTLLMLVAAFAGYRTTMAAYEHAIEHGYRFYSYGDAMVVTP